MNRDRRFRVSPFDMRTARPLPAVRVRRFAFTLALAGVLVAGCGSTESPPASATPVQLDTFEPSAAATTALADSLAAFEGHLRDATGREGELVRALAAASTGDPARMRSAIAQMHTWIDGEQAWLAAHAPLACFAAADAKFREVVASMTSAAEGFTALVAHSPGPSDDATGAAAGRALQDAARALADTATLAKTARTSCR